MNEEAKRLASKAWAEVRRQPSFFAAVFGEGANPMPADIAIDMVQDACSDRAEALAVLFEVAGDILDESKPAAREGFAGMWGASIDAANAVRVGNLDDAAAVHLQYIAFPLAFPDPRTYPLSLLEAYRQWTREAYRIVAICRQMKKLGE